MILGLLRTIIIILAIYFVVRILGRLFQPYLNPNRGKSNAGFRGKQEPNRSEGEVSVEFTSDKKDSKSGGSKKEGEYIDFEEID